MRAKRDIFSWINFVCRDGSNEVSHAHGRGLEVCLVPQAGTQAGTDPDRENRHYENIYIDIKDIRSASKIEKIAKNQLIRALSNAVFCMII